MIKTILKTYMNRQSPPEVKWFPAVIGAIYLFSLYLFTIIGRSNVTLDGSINSYATIIAWGLTAALASAVIYGTLLMNDQLVKQFIGVVEIQSFQIPGGKGVMFLLQLVIFVGKMLLQMLLALAVGSGVFLLLESILPVLNSQISVFNFAHVMQLILGTWSVSLFTISMVSLAGIFGIHYRSTRLTWIIAGLSIIIVGGLGIFMLRTIPFITLLLSIGLVVLVGLLAKGLATTLTQRSTVDFFQDGFFK